MPSASLDYENPGWPVRIFHPSEPGSRLACEFLLCFEFFFSCLFFERVIRQLGKGKDMFKIYSMKNVFNTNFKKWIPYSYVHRSPKKKDHSMPSHLLKSCCFKNRLEQHHNPSNSLKDHRFKAMLLCTRVQHCSWLLVTPLFAITQGRILRQRQQEESLLVKGLTSWGVSVSAHGDFTRHLRIVEY